MAGQTTIGRLRNLNSGAHPLLCPHSFRFVFRFVSCFVSCFVTRFIIVSGKSTSATRYVIPDLRSRYVRLSVSLHTGGDPPGFLLRAVPKVLAQPTSPPTRVPHGKSSYSPLPLPRPDKCAGRRGNKAKSSRKLATSFFCTKEIFCSGLLLVCQFLPKLRLQDSFRKIQNDFVAVS